MTPRDRSGSGSLISRARSSPSKGPEGSRSLASSGEPVDRSDSQLSEDHFEVAGKRYRRKRPRVDTAAYQARVDLFREDPKSYKPKTAAEKMALLESQTVWMGADLAERASEETDGQVVRFLTISEAFNQRLEPVVEMKDMTKNMSSGMENTRALEFLHRCQYDTDRASFHLAAAAGSGLERRFWRQNVAENVRARCGLRNSGSAPPTSRHAVGSAGKSRDSSKTPGPDGTKKQWKNWITRARKLLNGTDEAHTFSSIKLHEANAAKLPAVLVKPGTDNEKFVSDAQALQKSLQERVTAISGLVATAHDMLSGERKHEFSVGALDKLAKDIKKYERAVPVYGFVAKLREEIGQWKAKYDELLEKGTYSTRHFEVLLKEGEAFPVTIPEVADVSMRIKEAKAQGLRIRRIFPAFWEFHSGHNSGAKKVGRKESAGADPQAETVCLKPTIVMVEEMVKVVSSIGIETEELVMVKHELGRTKEWIAKVDQVGDNGHGTKLRALSTLLQESKSLPISVTEHSKRLNAALGGATEWMKKLKTAIPTQKKTRRSADGGGGNTKADLNELKKLLQEAEEFMSESHDGADALENIRDIVEDAEEWVEEAKEALGSDDMAPEEMRRLLTNGDRIPVEMDTFKLLDTEILRREWCGRAAKALGEEPFLSLESCEHLLLELIEVRSHLPASTNIEKYAFKGEKEIQANVLKAKSLIEEVDRLVDPPKNTVISKEEIDSCIDEIEAVAVDLSEYQDRVKAVKSAADTLQSTVADVVKQIESVKAHRADHAPWPIVDPASEQSGKQGAGGEFRGVDLKVMTHVLEDAEKGNVALEGIETIKEAVQKGSEWDKRARAIMPKQQRKRNFSSKPTMDEIKALCASTSDLSIILYPLLPQLQKEIDNATLWLGKAKQLIEESNVAMATVTSVGSEKVPSEDGAFETDEAVHVHFLEDYESLYGDFSTSVAVDTAEAKVLKYRILLMKWYRQAMPVLKSPEKGSKAEASRMLKSFEKLRSEDESIFPAGDVGNKGWRCAIYSHICEDIQRFSSNAAVMEAEMNRYFTLKPGDLKPEWSELEATLAKANKTHFLPKGVLSKIKAECRRARALNVKMLEALSGNPKVSLLKMTNMLSTHKKICVHLPPCDKIQAEIEKAQEWDQKVRSSGVEDGHASLEYLRKLVEEGEQINVILHNMPTLKDLTTPYCLCGNTSEGNMIGCDSCDNWFHNVCIGLETSVEEYYCPQCDIRRVASGFTAKVIESIKAYVTPEALVSKETFLAQLKEAGGNTTEKNNFGCIEYEVEAHFLSKLDHMFPANPAPPGATSSLNVPDTGNQPTGDSSGRTPPFGLGEKEFSTWLLALSEHLQSIFPQTAKSNEQGGNDKTETGHKQPLETLSTGEHSLVVFKASLGLAKVSKASKRQKRIINLLSATLELLWWSSDVISILPAKKALNLTQLSNLVRRARTCKKAFSKPNASPWASIFYDAVANYEKIKNRADHASRKMKKWSILSKQWLEEWNKWHHTDPTERSEEFPPAFKGGNVETAKSYIAKYKAIPVDQINQRVPEFEKNVNELVKAIEKDCEIYAGKRRKKKAVNSRKQAAKRKAERKEGNSAKREKISNGKAPTRTKAKPLKKTAKIVVGTKLLVKGRKCSVLQCQGHFCVLNFEDDILNNERIDLQTVPWEKLSSKKRKKPEALDNAVRNGVSEEAKGEKKKKVKTAAVNLGHEIII